MHDTNKVETLFLSRNSISDIEDAWVACSRLPGNPRNSSLAGAQIVGPGICASGIDDKQVDAQLDGRQEGFLEEIRN